MKSLFKKTYLIIIINLFANIVFAQDPFYKKIDKTNGLPSNSVYDIAQDKNFFLWFATDQGICKYDGNSFFQYETKNSSNKAGSNLVQDNLGRMWYINFDGYIFYTQNDNIRAITQENTIGYVPFFVAKNYVIYIQKNKIVAKNTTTFKTIKTIPFDSSALVNAFQAGNKFYVLSDFLIEIDNNLKIKELKLPIELKNIKSGILMEKVGDTLYLFNKTGGVFYTFQNGIFEKKQLEDKDFFIQNVCVINNQIWLCSTAGLARLNENKLDRFFKNINISSIFKDKSNSYWISTLNEGLLFVQDFKKTLITTKEIPISLFKKNNKLYYGSISNGLWQYDLASSKETIVQKTNVNHEVYMAKNLDGTSFITSSKFYAFDDKDKLLFSENYATKDIKKIDEKYFAIAASGFNAIFCINKNLKSEWDLVYNLKVDNNNTLSLKKASLNTNIKGKTVEYNPINKTIYFGTNEGIFAQSLTSNFKIKFEKKDIFPKNLFFYKSFIYGIDTNGNFYKIDFNNKVEKVVLSDVIPNQINKCKLINDNLFLFTDNAIYNYNFDSKTTFVELSSNQNLDVTDLEIIDKKIFFATKKGIIAKEIGRKPLVQIPPFVLNYVLINDNLKLKNIPNNLKFNQNTIAFNFAVLNFDDAIKFPIQYNINGKQWYENEENNKTIFLNELAAGNYTINFRIYSKTLKQYKVIKVSFQIDQPWWKSTLFVVMLILITIVLANFVYQQKVKKIMQINAAKLEKKSLENNLNKSKLQVIKSQMNPHFFYNALNTIQYYILSNNKKLAVDYLSKFSTLTRTILELTEKDFVTVSEEVETLQLYLDLEQARFSDQEHNFKIKVKNSHEIMKFKIPVMLLQPYVENALKHGLLHKEGLKSLIVSFEKKENYLEIEIDDNGIGRKRSLEINESRTNKPKSFATKATDSRIDILQQYSKSKIEVVYTDKINENQYSLGTTVTFKIFVPQQNIIL